MDGIVLNRGERFGALLRIGHISVEQRQIELNVQRLFIELPRKIHAGFRRIDVLVQIQHEIIANDAVARCEEGHQPFDQMLLGRLHARTKIGDVGREIDFFHRPCILDRRLEHLEIDGILHRAKREIESWIENHDFFGLISFTGKPRRIPDSPANRRLRSQPLSAHRHRCLRDFRSRARAEVVRCLQPLLPRVHVHGRELADGRAFQKQIERLALVDIGASFGRHVDERTHGNFPDGAIDLAQIGGNLLHPLDSCLPPS